MAGRSLPITLVLVSYNKADVVSLAVESAARGSVPPDLLVVSDDGSSDGTPEVAEAAAKKAGIPCRVIRHQRVGRYRIQAMRNTCAQNALDGVVYLSDSDCLFGRYTLESHRAIHEQHRDAIGTGPRFEFVAGSSGPFTSTFTTLEYAHFPYAMHCVPVGANYSFTKRFWKRQGGFDRAFDGSYGMEEFEFSARAEKAGGVCVSDPGAYVFHIPHQTIFGNRSPYRNIAVFNRKYQRDHVGEEHYFIERRVVPWYWRGGRKPPLVGEQLELDSWGAPAGFAPPLHLRLSRTLRPLIDPVAAFVDGKGHGDLGALRAIPMSLDWKTLARTSPGFVYLSELHSVLRSSERAADVVPRLQRWLEGARGVESELARGAAVGCAP
jgi:GT2 family glycosyltransferase